MSRLIKQPLAIALGFTSGALLILLQPALPSPALIFAVGLSAVVLMLSRSRFRMLYAAVILGALMSFWQAQHRLAERWPEVRTGEEIAMQGSIVSLPQAESDDYATSPAASGSRLVEPYEAHDQAGTSTKTWHFLFAPEQPEKIELPSRIRVSWYRSEADLKAGQCWRFGLRMRAPRGSLNPGGSDYEAWLFRQGIGAVATVRDGEPCGTAEGHLLLRLRQSISDRIHTWLPNSSAEPLIAALAVADKTGLHESDWNVFRETGTIHLMVIAGLHVGFLAAFAFWLIRWSWSRVPALCLRLPAQRAGLFGSLAVALIYALLADLDPPVLRATLMMMALAAAALLGGLSRPSRALAFAWLLVVATDPLGLLSPGLWLSFGAVGAILYVHAGHHAAASGRRGFRDAGFWIELLQLQLILGLALAPLTVFWFQGASWIGVIANLTALPVMGLLLPALLGALLLAWLLPAIGLPALHAVAAAIGWAYQGLSWVAAHTPDAWLSATAEPAALALALLGVLLLFAPRGLPLKILAMLCFLPLLLPPQRAPKAGFELTALDVGQGLAVVIRTAHHSLLFDAGPASEQTDSSFDSGRSVVVPYLLHEGIRHLDVMMISHTDLDHRGGAPAVRQLIDVRVERGALAGTPCVAGQNWDWDGVHFEVLSGPASETHFTADSPQPPAISRAQPDSESDSASTSAAQTNSPDRAAGAPASAERPAKKSRSQSTNNGGCVLRVATGTHAALLPADIEHVVETALVESIPGALHADVLIAPHHGSKTSSSPEFVAAVSPSVVIFPAGFHNPFRHPRAEVVARYQAIGSQLFMTGHDGAVSLDVDPDRGVQNISEYRLESPRLWSAPVLPVPTDNR